MPADGRLPPDEGLCPRYLPASAATGSVTVHAPFVAHTVTKGACRMSKPRFSTRTLTALAMLIAIEIVLSRFLSLNTWNMKIGFSFIPVVVAAVLFGPLAAGTAAALADLIGALLFPIGTYFPGFTLTAFLVGFVFGLFLYRKQTWLRILCSVLIHQFVLSLLLNTLWISILYGSPYLPLLTARLVQCAVQTAVQLVLIPVIVRTLARYRKKASAE